MTAVGIVRFQETVLGLKMHEVQRKDESVINSKVPWRMKCYWVGQKVH